MTMSNKKISSCLDTIGVLASHLEGCQTLREEFQGIKKVYFRKILEAHPDKGGDPQVFRSVQTSFEVLREIFAQSKISSFVTEADKRVDDYDLDYEETFHDFGDRPTPSWDYYHEAAEDDVPLYRVELAKSSQGRCHQTTKMGKKCGDVNETVKIEKGEIRVGNMDYMSGSYSRWSHLACWRVPSRIWLGLPYTETETDPQAFAKALSGMEEVLLSGFADLPEDKQAEVVEHVMDKEHHARLIKKKKKKTELLEAEDSKLVAIASEILSGAASASTSTSAVALLPSNALKTARQGFLPPVPGKNGGVVGALSGKTIVMTGIFPEVGGGAGLGIGKDKVKRIIESFGGRVTGSVSGKTSFLLVGKEPGMSKVSNARGRNIQLMGLHDLKQVCEGLALQDAQPAVIGAFSSGYSRNGNALTASRQDLQALRAPPPKPGTTIEAERKPAAKISKKEAAGSKAKKKSPPPTVDPGATKSKDDVHVKPPVAKKRKMAATKKKVAPKVEPTDAENVPTEDDVHVKPPVAKKRKTAATKKKVAPKVEPTDTENVPLQDDVHAKQPAKKRKTTATEKKIVTPKAEPMDIEKMSPEGDVHAKPPAKETAAKRNLRPRSSFRIQRVTPKAEPMDTENMSPEGDVHAKPLAKETAAKKNLRPRSSFRIQRT